MGKIRNLVNKKFGRLTVIKFSHKDKHHKAHWYCECECGNTKAISRSSLTKGSTKSCGCAKIELLKSKNRKAQMSEYNKSIGRWCGKKNPGYGKTGDANISRNPEVREKISLSKLGDNNPSKRLDVRKKISESRVGRFAKENSPNWKGGISRASDILRSTPEYREWRTSIFKRDKFTCKKCNKKKSGELESHHIDSVNNNMELITSTNNGITLCKSCHKEFHDAFGYGNNNRLQLSMFLGDTTMPFS